MLTWLLQQQLSMHEPCLFCLCLEELQWCIRLLQSWHPQRLVPRYLCSHRAMSDYPVQMARSSELTGGSWVISTQISGSAQIVRCSSQFTFQRMIFRAFTGQSAVSPLIPLKLFREWASMEHMRSCLLDEYAQTLLRRAQRTCF